MKKAKIFADKNMQIGKVESKMFGSFIEHLGRAVYEGIYEPGHPAADENGFRKDVISLINELGVPIVRYPGGNFVSGYNWLDGIGKKENRPTRLDYAWRTIETNQFGTDEFMKWCEEANVEPMMAVNMGTGAPQDAGYLVEYCNHPSGTYYSELRKANGSEKPYKVKYWCLGNEMDGPWQICHLEAIDYSKKALETAKIIRWVDNRVKLIACGSSSAELPSYPDWDRIILENLYDYVDYLSIHQYYWNEGCDEDFYASYKRMDEFIKTAIATCDFVKAKKRSNKTIYLSFDEWNVWYLKDVKLEDWTQAPHILEDKYTLQDAIVFGGLMNTLLNNCHRIKIACLAQLVNVIAPIFTQKGGAAIRQTTFYPFKYVSQYGRGQALMTISECDEFDSKFGKVKELSQSVIFDEDANSLAVFVCNYSQDAIEAEIELRSFGDLEIIEHVVLDGADLKAINDFENPSRVTPKNVDLGAIKDSKAFINLSPLSWNMIRVKIK
ncbi:MAG TPA: alpha-N-arabinofuranosidase [Clostridiales bacterium]|nr:alpha-N-arabinofuranosidase [Clostridiales bacterium]